MSDWDYPNKAHEQRQSEIDYLRDKEAEIERLYSAWQNLHKVIDGKNEEITKISKERDALRDQLQQERDLVNAIGQSRDRYLSKLDKVRENTENIISTLLHTDDMVHCVVVRGRLKGEVLKILNE